MVKSMKTNRYFLGTDLLAEWTKLVYFQISDDKAFNK